MNIYVGNLAYDANEDDLKEAFAAFGQVNSVNIIRDKFSGQSRGFGFVEMADSEPAQAAIAALNEKPLKGRNMIVNEAKPRPEGGRSGGGGGGGQRRGRGPKY